LYKIYGLKNNNIIAPYDECKLRIYNYKENAPIVLKNYKLKSNRGIERAHFPAGLHNGYVIIPHKNKGIK
jgi:hypothetical protein